MPLGPQARQLLAGFFTDDPDDYLFSPRRAVQEVRLKRAEERRTPRYPSQDRRREATKKEEPRRKPSSRYQRQSYLNAVIRACDQAFPAPAPLGRAEGESVAAWRARLTADQRAALAEWRRTHRWCPYRIRHTVATKIREQVGLDAAQQVLGHKSRATTEGYARPAPALAREVAERLG